MELGMREQGKLSTKGRICTVLISILLVNSLMLMGISSPRFAEADEVDSETSRAIAIAYDNSGSMANGTDKWCNAQYSLEVLAAMMGNNDTICLYAMDSPGEKLSISGSSPASERADKVHTTDLGVSDWTDPRATQDAYNWVLNQNADEKYLVITTDGNFNVGGGLADVRNVVNEAKANGITVIYLAIGSEAELLAPDEPNGIYVKQANGDSILSTMTEVANLIFGRAALDPSMYTDSGKVDIEVPMSKLIVFAQGPNVSVGDLTTSDENSVQPTLARVSYRERMTDGPNQYGGDNPNTSLQGVVATYEADIPKGECNIDISGAESLEIYYQVNVGIAVDLTDAEGFTTELTPDAQNIISEGNYTVSYSFFDPNTNEPLTSSLLDNAQFTFQVDNGSEVVNVSNGEQIELLQGQATMSATVNTTDGVRIHQNYQTVDIVPPAVPLDIKLISAPSDLSVYNLDTSQPLVYEVTKDGEPLTQEEWDGTVMTVTASQASHPDDVFGWFFGTEKDLSISEVTKGNDVGTYVVKLSDYDNDPAKTLSGSVTLQASAEYNTGNGMSIGESADTISIEGLSTLDSILNWIKMHLLQLILLVLLLLLILFIIMEIRKPRLPRINPRLSGAYDGEDIQLVYSAKKTQNKIWPPWAPEENTIKVIPKDRNDRHKLERRFYLGKMKNIRVIATKTNRGGRGFRISDDTLQRMMNGGEEYPDPSYAGEKSVFTPGSGFNFQGLKPHKRRGWDKPEQVSYRITF